MYIYTMHGEREVGPIDLAMTRSYGMTLKSWQIRSFNHWVGI